MAIWGSSNSCGSWSDFARAKFIGLIWASAGVANRYRLHVFLKKVSLALALYIPPLSGIPRISNFARAKSGRKYGLGQESQTGIIWYQINKTTLVVSFLIYLYYK